MKKPVSELLNDYVPHRPSNGIYALSKFVFHQVAKKHKVHYFYDLDVEYWKNKQIILISDHASRDNVYYLHDGHPLDRLNPVMGYGNVYDKKIKLYKKYGVIPKFLYSPDLNATKNMLRLIHKEKASIELFPEGIQSTYGNTHPINPATLKFLKKAGLPLILCKSHGLYCIRPRYSRTYRKGYAELRWSVLVNEEEIKTLSEEELYNKILKEFSYNDFEWNRKERHAYTCDQGNAKELTNIIFYCPKCHSIHTLKEEDDKLVCTKCGNTIRINEYYDLIPEEGSFMPYKGIDEWGMDQRRVVRELVKDENYQITYNCKLGRLNDYLTSDDNITVGEGVCTINKDGVHYIGTYNGEPFDKLFNINMLPSIPMNPNAYNDIYYNNEYFSIEPIEDKYKVNFYMLLVEEFHNLIDPSWRKASEDVYEKKIED